MMADANLEKWSSALSVLSTAAAPTASLLCSETYQSSKTFPFYSQGATNTSDVSQQTPAIQIPLCKPVHPVAQTLPLPSEDLGWHRKNFMPTPTSFFKFSHAISFRKDYHPSRQQLSMGKLILEIFLVWSKRLHFPRHSSCRSQVSLAECFQLYYLFINKTITPSLGLLKIVES